MPVTLPHALPTEASAAGDQARRYARALGPAYQAPDGSANAAEFLALGQGLADQRATVARCLDQAFVDTATDLLDELEEEYGLTRRHDLPDADRQARLLAKVRAARAGSPQDLLRAVHAIDPTATLSETTIAAATAGGYPRGVFRFAVVVAAATHADAAKLAQVRALIEQMKPAYTQGCAVVHVGFFTDDANSRVDRDALGS